MLDVQKAREEYATRGFTVLDGCVQDDLCRVLAFKAKDFLGQFHRVSRPQGAAGPLDDGEPYDYWILPREGVTRLFPELEGVYATLPGVLGEITGEHVIVSPHRDSAISVKVHIGSGGLHGAHRDTNPITALLYLTDCESGRTVGKTLEGLPFECTPRAGRMLVMQGRRLWHRGEEVQPGDFKVCVPFNFYTPTDTWRPAGMDDFIYGGGPK